MRREWFKYELSKKRSSFSSIAKRLEISRAAVSQGILRPSLRLADAVSADLDKPKRELWPGRFSA